LYNCAKNNNFNSINKNFAVKNHKKVKKQVKKAKITRKTGNKHFFEKSMKKALLNLIIERVVTRHTLPQHSATF